MPESDNKEMFKYPGWYLEALRGAGLLDEQGRHDDATRVRYLAKQALATYLGVNIKDSDGNLILGEDEGSQAQALQQQLKTLLKNLN